MIDIALGFVLGSVPVAFIVMGLIAWRADRIMAGAMLLMGIFMIAGLTVWRSLIGV